jgi:hypothetical protein
LGILGEVMALDILARTMHTGASGISSALVANCCCKPEADGLLFLYGLVVFLLSVLDGNGELCMSGYGKRLECPEDKDKGGGTPLEKAASEEEEE